MCTHGQSNYNGFFFVVLTLIISNKRSSIHKNKIIYGLKRASTSKFNHKINFLNVTNKKLKHLLCYNFLTQIKGLSHGQKVNNSNHMNNTTTNDLLCNVVH